jgi:hypothetical protein
MSAQLKTYISGPLLPLITKIITENSVKSAATAAEIAAHRVALATNLTDAISTAVATGVAAYLNANVKVLPNQAVATKGGPSSQTGFTIAPGNLIAP